MVKLRCDARQTFPGPCTRCSSRHVECMVDPAFRRTPARQRLHEMSQELMHLRRSVKGVSSSKFPAQSQDDEANITDERCSSLNDPTPQEMEEALLDCPDLQIGRCHFTKDELKCIFATFVSYYHVHLPIMALPINPKMLHVSSPFLFWTIVTVVVQRASGVYGDRGTALTAVYRSLLEKAILSTPLTLSTIQALLLVCAWPFSVEYQARDQTWTLVGIATNAALYSGLHKPSHPQSLRSVGVFVSSRSKATIWLACFYLSTNISQAVGLVPFLRSPEELAVICQMCKDESVPRQLAALAEIHACAAKYTSLVSEAGELHLAILLERTFKQELDLTKSRYATHWTSAVEIVFLDVKLHLIATLAVSQSRQRRDTNEGSSNLSKEPSFLAVLSDGLIAATGLVRTLCLGMDQSRHLDPLQKFAMSTDDLYMRGLPKVYFRALAFAAFYLLRYHIYGDKSTAEEHAKIALDYLRQHSTRPNDEPYRAAAVIEVLMRYSDAVPNASLRSTQIKDRLGASLYFEALSHAGELRSRPTRLASDRDQPQQELGVAVERDIEPAEEGPSTENVDQDFLANLPEDWWENLDFDTLELSGELFAGTAAFTS